MYHPIIINLIIIVEKLFHKVLNFCLQSKYFLNYSKVVIMIKSYVILDYLLFTLIIIEYFHFCKTLTLPS